MSGDQAGLIRCEVTNTYVHYDRLISFLSVNHAIRAEKELSRAGFSVAPIPTPQEIDISCGQCLLFMAGSQQEILAELAKRTVPWSKLYSCDLKRRVFEKIRDFNTGGQEGF